MTTGYQTFEYTFADKSGNIDIRDFTVNTTNDFKTKIDFGLIDKTEKTWVCTNQGEIPSDMIKNIIYNNTAVCNPINGKLSQQKYSSFIHLPFQATNILSDRYLSLCYFDYYGSFNITQSTKTDNDQPFVTSNCSVPFNSRFVEYYNHAIPIFDLEKQTQLYGIDPLTLDLSFISGEKNIYNDVLLADRGKIIEKKQILPSPNLTESICLLQIDYQNDPTINGLGKINKMTNRFGSISETYFSYIDDPYHAWENKELINGINKYKGFLLTQTLNTNGNNIVDNIDLSMNDVCLEVTDENNISHFIQYFDHRSKPELFFKEVRKYKPNYLTQPNVIRLYNLNKYNQYGSPVISLNENGWANVFHYNSFNALNKAILPYDFYASSDPLIMTVDDIAITGDASCNHISTTKKSICEKRLKDNYFYNHNELDESGSFNVIDDNLICSYYLIMDISYNWCKCLDDGYYSDTDNLIYKDEKNNDNSPLLEYQVVCHDEKLIHQSKYSSVNMQFNKPADLNVIKDLSELTLNLTVSHVNGINNIVIEFDISEIKKTIKFFIESNSISYIDPGLPITYSNNLLTINLKNLYSDEEFINNFNNGCPFFVKIKSTNSFANEIGFLNGIPNQLIYYPIENISAPNLRMKGDFDCKLKKDEFTVKYDYQFNYQDNTGYPYQFVATKHLKLDNKNRSNLKEEDWQSNSTNYSFREVNTQNVFGREFNLLKVNQTPAFNGSVVPQKTFEYDNFGNQTTNNSIFNDGSFVYNFDTKTEYDLMGRVKNVKYQNINLPFSSYGLNAEPSSYGLNAEPSTSYEYQIDKPTKIFENQIFSREFKDWFDVDDDYKYFGVCNATLMTNQQKKLNDGTPVKYPTTASYKDALGRLRGEIVFTNDTEELLRIMKAVKYEYNHKHQLTHIKTLKSFNPFSVENNEQTTRYWYDKFGRIKYKYQPDIGIQSFAYDDLGNLRFSQNANQVKTEDNDKISFYEYDDLNRLLIVGEALIDETSIGGTGRTKKTSLTSEDLGNDDLNIQWLTDVSQLKVNELNHGIANDILTSNKTLFIQPLYAYLPSYIVNPGDIWPNENCIPLLYKRNNLILGTDNKPQAPFIQHPGYFYEPFTVASPINQFEDIATYPQNILRAYYYDELPESYGAVWEKFPSASKWNAMVPLYPGQISPAVANLKGKLSAVAYREHNGQPFNYQVFSYDARGRLIALLRFTDNIGFDAVYYDYNSSDKLLSVRTVDANNDFITWYDYDNFGRLSKVWTSNPNTDNNKGLCGVGTNWHNNSPTYTTPDILPSSTQPAPEIEYSYYSNHLLKQKDYKINSNTYSTNYSYNQRLWLTGIKTTNPSDPYIDKFEQVLTYNNSMGFPQITQQNLSYDFNQEPQNLNEYSYDYSNQLISSNDDSYEYDKVGNRMRTDYYNFFSIPNGRFNTQYAYSDLNSPNRLTSFITTPYYDPMSIIHKSDKLYHPNGALKKDINKRLLESNQNSQLWKGNIGLFNYDMFGLLNKYNSFEQYGDDINCLDDNFDVTLSNEWRYSYNPFNEREQKRFYYSFGGNNGGRVYPWVYYQLGVNNQQYVVYNGFQISDPSYNINNTQICTNPFPELVFMYPVEYNTYGADGKTDLTWTLDNTGNYKKDFNIFDHLGNLRMRIRDNGQTADIISRFDYKPFGEKMPVTPPLPGAIEPMPQRIGFISKEQDRESRLADHGVRKYDYDLGRFTSTEPLWEKYPGWSPYQYSLNNPINMLDWNGYNTFLIIIGSSYMNYEMEGQHGDVGNNFLLAAQTRAKEIRSSDNFNKEEDEVVLVEANSTDEFISATNKKYETGKIEEMSVFSHGYFGGISLGGERGNVEQKENYDKREINKNTMTQIDKNNFSDNAQIRLNGCNIGQYFAQVLSNFLGLPVFAFMGPTQFKTTSAGKKVEATDPKRGQEVFYPNQK